VARRLNNEFKDKTSIVILSKIINEDFAYIKLYKFYAFIRIEIAFISRVREKGLVYYITVINQE
jgi:hypothetical protein